MLGVIEYGCFLKIHSQIQEYHFQNVLVDWVYF